MAPETHLAGAAALCMLLISGTVLTAQAGTISNGSDSPGREDPEQAAGEPAARDARVEAALRAFRQRSASEQKKTLLEVRAAVEKVDDPYLRSVRSWIARFGAAGTTREHGEKHPRLPQKHGSAAPRGGGRGSRGDQREPASDRTLWRELGFPVRQEYVYGYGRVVPSPDSDSKARGRDEKDRALELRAMLLGYLPDLDLALAAMLRELDADRRADGFAKLLETWRNGSESFYRALDRTAGSAESVFFYDAMLGDFVKSCVPKSDPYYQRIRGGNAPAHDALHAAFLAYRQYRGLREACALALLLPPDAPLPGPLARYEEKQAGGYSLRQEVAMLLADADQDVGEVIHLLAATAAALPESLWQDGGYDAFSPFLAAFNQRQPRMIERAGSTDQLLESQNTNRARAQRKVARAALSAFVP